MPRKSVHRLWDRKCNSCVPRIANQSVQCALPKNNEDLKMDVKGKLRGIAYAALAVMVVAVLASCGKKEEAKVEKAAEKVAVDVKAKAEADAKAAEVLAKEVEAREAAIDAYIYGYPLVTMEMTRRVMTNVASPEATRAPM